LSNDYISKQEIKGDSNLLKMSFAVSKDTKYRVKDKGKLRKNLNFLENIPHQNSKKRYKVNQNHSEDIYNINSGGNTSKRGNSNSKLAFNKNISVYDFI